MEDYHTFVQHRLSQLRRRGEEHNKPSPVSSLIRFYGRSILPPLLSGEQRKEMQQHRHAAQKAVAHMKLKDDPRMAYVQTILHSVQLRKMPTLEELLQESDFNIKSSYCHNTSDGAMSQSQVRTKDSVFLSPMTSTAYSAFCVSDVTGQQTYHKGCLIDQHDSQQGSQPSADHHSVSSGYVTNENVENTISVSGRIDLESGSHGFGSSGGVYNMGGFFLHNTSNTVAKMPDIISYPPIDGEELERSGLESSFSNNFIGMKDICSTSFQEDSIICDHFLGEKSENNLVGTEGADNPPFTTILDYDKDHSVDRIEVSENNSIKFSQTIGTHHCPTGELHIQHDPKETKPTDSYIDEAEPSEEPYRLSLQALLKKSQEYRRRQRMLRNQAKNTKIQERTQEQPGARAEEQSLSDKENDEFSYKGTVTAEGKKTKDRKGPFIPILETSAKKSWQNAGLIESEFVGKNINVNSKRTVVGKTDEMPSVVEDTVFKNNKLNSLQEVIIESKKNGAIIQHQPLSTENSLVEEAFYSTTCPSAFYNRVEKFYNIPAPNFCRSPVHCKSRGSIKDGGAVDGAEKVVINTGLNEDHKLDEESSLGHQNIHTTVVSPVSLTVEDDVTNALAKSSTHIDQLESSLSSLKVLISDLESTVKENLENPDQTENNTQSGCSVKGIKCSEQMKNYQNLQLCQSDCDYLEKGVKDDCDSKDAEYMEWARGQSFDTCQITHEDTGPEPIFSDTDDVSLIVEAKGTERVNLSELSVVKTMTVHRKKEKWTGKEGLTKNYGCRKQPPAKSILSVAQRMRVPNIFRNVPPETTSPSNVLVLSDTSNYPVGRRNEITAEGHGSLRSPSLNQSYDVDTPSDLWLLDGSGSDLASKSYLAQEKHLTPESAGDGQGGVSKVKRRLLMHATEERQEKSPDNSGGAGTVVRPNSSTPRAAVWGYRGHGSHTDRQAQLKQVHAAQVRALQDEHRRQQEELLQELAVRYLQSVSFPCSMSASRLGDTLTFSTLSQPSSPFSEHCRPLLSAVMKGFLTRRLLRTERVAQLVRTIRDTQQFLQVLQQQSPTNRQDLLLEERVTLQLRAARYEVYDIFFSLSTRERMQLISWDRELARERELRRQGGHIDHPRGKNSLSAATQKSLERKRGMMIQKKAAERHRGVVTRSGHKTGFSAEQPLETKRGQFRANPPRIPKSTYSTRPR